MPVYKITIAYDGTDFCGWQHQPGDLTIQSVLKKTFEHAFLVPVDILGASRTDSGVHAIGAVARVKTDLVLDPQILMESWNRLLPKSILIRNIKVADNNFHPFYNVSHKTYYYQLFLKRPLPFISRFGWYYNFIDHVNIQKFQAALNLYIGKHDFASFCKQDKSDNRSTIRTIDKIVVRKIKKLNILRIEITGKSFLRYQIRRMIGYALDLARQDHLSLSYLEGLLKNPDHKQILLKADACGLILRRVVYKDELIKK
ncbi:tRNA pseudouridine(38-40) synthase TruA [Candidatus Dependentiae bacterium]|nr:tRNA pseudouridine(38-40) synthase TruA [Candidatus Dependentiae bacterium]MBU4387760.1 tRNA pseudouridine(38-40) synthase TruA [Candidatus Dependentiae bacterium]MCG2755879.1 tRNA pseudouridine(38-40) synthase TruA [Candidatus Dependentiae bacterium]